ncbi:hypothetical protein FGIG_07243 [Fasciola gigantica]|uniref:Uncharacterized protein n=1 Tax=Fasciola gigantica TaxID=46835 RepID=A0A504Y7N2_FASGI|nr:hypothetical protein FGIG_07243 [Fasciola gigantica]
MTKYDPLQEEVELLHCNLHYAHIRYPDGNEDTVSVRHLDPKCVEDKHEDITVDCGKGKTDLPSAIESNIEKCEIPDIQPIPNQCCDSHEKSVTLCTHSTTKSCSPLLSEKQRSLTTTQIILITALSKLVSFTLEPSVSSLSGE